MGTPVFSVIGHCTSNSAKLYAVFDPRVAAVTSARLAYEIDGAVHALDAITETAAPYVLARFELSSLPTAADGTRIKYAVTGAQSAAALPDAAGTLLSQSNSSFRLLPTGRPPRIAVVSCNGLFAVDPARRYLLWDALQREIDVGAIDAVVHAGDQIYADPIRSRFESDASFAALDLASCVAKLVPEYHEWYVRTWSASPIARVLGSCPSVMMWDDHEIYDGWGSNDFDDRGVSRAYFLAAGQAFQNFQAWLNPKPIGSASLSSVAMFGDVAVLLLDCRSNRRYSDCKILGDAAYREMGLALDALSDPARTAELKHLFVVVGTPFVHVSIVAALKVLETTPWHEEGTDDLRDAWTSPGNQAEGERLLLRLFEFAKQRQTTQVTFLSGDVHTGSVGQIESSLPIHRRADGSPSRIYQVVSSGIGTPPPGGIVAAVLNRLAGGGMDLVGKDVRGELFRLPARRGNSHLIARRHFAVLRFEDSRTNGWDTHQNIAVQFFAEEPGHATPVQPVRYVLRGR